MSSNPTVDDEEGKRCEEAGTVAARSADKRRAVSSEVTEHLQGGAADGRSRERIGSPPPESELVPLDIIEHPSPDQRVQMEQDGVKILKAEKRRAQISDLAGAPSSFKISSCDVEPPSDSRQGRNQESDFFWKPCAAGVPETPADGEPDHPFPDERVRLEQELDVSLLKPYLSTVLPCRSSRPGFGAAPALLVVWIFLALAETPDLVAADKVEDLFHKMEFDIKDFTREVERVYANRCNMTTLEGCYNANYDACLSNYPSQTCKADNQLTIPNCAEGSNGECGGLFDYTISTVRIPTDLADGDNGNPIDKGVIETVCYSKELDKWMVDKYNSDRSFWEEFSVKSPQMYFGAHDGTFRIFPARHSPECGSYDPRLRPWYIAGSSGPKNVVLILDTSGSMAVPTNRRLNLMKQAASLIVKTLTVADRISVVEFNTNAHSTPTYVATEENKQKLIDKINGFDASGGTNFYEAFGLAFDTLEATVEAELHNCNTAFIFLTDGEMTRPDGMEPAQVLEMIVSRKEKYEAANGDPIFIFTFSIDGETDVHTLPKNIACQTQNGVWSEIVDDDNLVSSMSSYYKLFALGLGEEGGNKDFAAWVEPYTFATGGAWGTTVSSPVYDRSVLPPLFVGVVGLDFTLATLDIALGLQPGTSNEDVHPETLQEVVAKSTARCPKLNLMQCVLESYRKASETGSKALCTNNCTESDFVPIEPERCSAVSDYPSNLWANTLNSGLSYEERVCCLAGTKEPSDQCPVRNENEGTHWSTGTVVGISIGAVAAACLGCFCVHRILSRSKEPPLGIAQTVVAVPATDTAHVMPTAPVNPNYTATNE